jgi:arylsulfatase A-like enzyme
VVKTLEAQGVADNTLIIFTSDNGGMFNHGGQTAFADGHRQNGDLLGFKFGAWEGGHRIPFIAKWPGHIAPGSSSDQMISSLDMLATFAAITEQEVEPAQLADSVNVLSAFVSDPTSPVRELMVVTPYNPNNITIRKGKWVYIGARNSGGFVGKPGVHAAGGAVCAAFVGSVNSDFDAKGKIAADAPPAQLYDLEADVNQTRNVYNEYPEVVKEMAALFESYTSQAKIPANRRRNSKKQ